MTVIREKVVSTASTTEQAIREAAIQLISKGGYESMSLRQLAALAGVNTGTLYLYYQGKKELLVSLVLDYLEALLFAWQNTRPRHAGADAELQAFVAFHVRYHLLKKEEGVLGNMELRSLEDDDLETVKQARHAYLREIQNILERGIIQGLFDCNEPKLLAHILFNMLTHVCSWYRPSGPLSIDEIIAQYSQLSLRMTGYSTHPRATV
ncbi:TetR/AcrR family transcriptional regulator [Pseudomonas lopnurensis]|uniref:TetR/AcrR family transcriptional regulator n=1 Tax=Pseudomonas lopnurensis TaxID=1477517 RepID=UPI001879FD9A|nr:TetR/AcrR family transcriptional regulator [Pseudomonas lopnurensis]MBE7373773.1 TetR family transcriptional regulator [Pseudomonas lopnurensis]